MMNPEDDDDYYFSKTHKRFNQIKTTEHREKKTLRVQSDFVFALVYSRKRFSRSYI